MLLMLVAATLLSQAPASCGALSRASSPVSECPAKVQRKDFGWRGLLRQGDGYALVPLRTRKDDGGDSYNGLCAKEPNVEFAVKSDAVKAGPVKLVTLEGDSNCALPKKKVTLDGTGWSITPGEKALRLASTRTQLDFAWDSQCWTQALFGDFDRDGLPDLVLSRVGGGYVTVLFLSSLQDHGVVPGCARMNGPND